MQCIVGYSISCSAMLYTVVQVFYAYCSYILYTAEITRGVCYSEYYISLTGENFFVDKQTIFTQKLKEVGSEY